MLFVSSAYWTWAVIDLNIFLEMFCSFFSIRSYRRFKMCCYISTFTFALICWVAWNDYSFEPIIVTPVMHLVNKIHSSFTKRRGDEKYQAIRMHLIHGANVQSVACIYVTAVRAMQYNYMANGKMWCAWSKLFEFLLEYLGSDSMHFASNIQIYCKPITKVKFVM